MYKKAEQITKNTSLIADYYVAHLDELRGYVQGRIGCLDTAKDIVQTVFERLLKSDKMISEITLPALCYAIARNLISDYWRHRRIVEEYEHIISSSISDVNSNISPESVYSVKETICLLEQGVARLSERQREVYTLNIYKGMKVQEISRTLNMNYKSVENSLGLARKQIRSFIKSRLAV